MNNMNEDNERPAISIVMVSDCCYAPVYDLFEFGDEICSRCKEHCESVPDESTRDALIADYFRQFPEELENFKDL